jgi:hypothetical protein
LLLLLFLRFINIRLGNVVDITDLFPKISIILKFLTFFNMIGEEDEATSMEEFDIVWLLWIVSR